MAIPYLYLQTIMQSLMKLQLLDRKRIASLSINGSRVIRSDAL